MGSLTFVGRALFASIFVFTAAQEYGVFGTNGGNVTESLRPIHRALGNIIPESEIKHLTAASMALKGAGSFLFVLGSPIGAYLLLLDLLTTTPALHDLYHHPFGSPDFLQSFMKFSQEGALFGALLFFIGMKNSIQRRYSKKRPPKRKAA